MQRLMKKFENFFTAKTLFFTAVIAFSVIISVFISGTAPRKTSASKLPGSIKHEQSNTAIIFSNSSSGNQNTLLRRNRRASASTSAPFSNNSIIYKSSVITIFSPGEIQYCFDGGKEIFHKFLKFSLPLRARPQTV